MVPEQSNKPYDVRAVIRAVVDEGDLFWIAEKYAANIVVGFARINTRLIWVPVGLLAV